MSAFKYQWNQTIDVGTAGLLSKQWTSIRHILSLLVTANACVHVTAYVAVRRSLSTTYTAVVLGLLLRQYVSHQFGVWAGYIIGHPSRFQSTFGMPLWWSLLGLFSRCLIAKKPKLIWRSCTSRFLLRVPVLQLIWNELTKREGSRIIAHTMAARKHTKQRTGCLYDKLSWYT